MRIISASLYLSLSTIFSACLMRTYAQIVPVDMGQALYDESQRIGSTHLKTVVRLVRADHNGILDSHQKDVFDLMHRDAGDTGDMGDGETEDAAKANGALNPSQAHAGL